MIALRLASFFLAAESLACLFITENGVASTLLAAAFLVFFSIFCWTLRVPTRKAR